MPPNFFYRPQIAQITLIIFFFDSLFDFVKCARQMTQIFFRCAMVFRHDNRRTWFLSTNYHIFFYRPQIAQITLIIFFWFALWLRQMRSTDDTDFFSLRDFFVDILEILGRCATLDCCLAAFFLGGVLYLFF